MLIFGVILLFIGISLFFAHRSQKQKLFCIKAARSVTAAELAETAGAVAAEIGGGSWRDYVKLWGQVTVEKPLYSEHKQAPCVHFNAIVEREYETRNKEGELEQKTERCSSNRQSTKFWLRDRTGQILVDPDGAAIETVEIMDEFRRERSGSTLGYRYKEAILPVDREVLVVGAASDLTGSVIIGQPTKAEHKYIISLQDEEKLASKTSRDANAVFYSMIVCLVAGAVLIVVGLLR